MLDGTLFFVKSARYKKPDKIFVRHFYVLLLQYEIK